jgi:hypothetical protein
VELPAFPPERGVHPACSASLQDRVDKSTNLAALDRVSKMPGIQALTCAASQLTNGRPLAVLAKAIIKAHGLLEKLAIDTVALDR